MNGSAPTPAIRLGRRYATVFVAYLAAMLALFALGFEAIYGHPTPFYALFRPVFPSAAVPLLMAAAMALLYHVFSSRLRTRTRWQQLRLGLVWCGLGALALAVLAYNARVTGAPGLTLLARYVPALARHGLVLAIAGGALALLVRVLQRAGWPHQALPPRPERWFPIALAAFLFVFAGSVAMLRGGTLGISQAYARSAYDFVGDIGVTGSIRDLFARYLDVRPYLSMHAKVHPPGPIAVLWMLSWFVGRSPLALSVTTMAVGSASVVPLYHWIRDLASARIAQAAAVLYVGVPSVVLFTATSADILFMPVTLTTLWCFGRAMDRASTRYAIAAGLGYAAMTLLKFSLVAVGVWFGFVGLWYLMQRRAWPVVKTAAYMLAALFAVYGLLWLWSGYDPIATFQACKLQFDTDQFHLDEYTPRYPAWSWRLLNPACWFYFAGIPVSLWCVQELWRAVRGEVGGDGDSPRGTVPSGWCVQELWRAVRGGAGTSGDGDAVEQAAGVRGPGSPFEGGASAGAEVGDAVEQAAGVRGPGSPFEGGASAGAEVGDVRARAKRRDPGEDRPRATEAQDPASEDTGPPVFANERDGGQADRARGTVPLRWCILATLVVLDVLYLARGEGERSALYVFPFAVLAAAMGLERYCARREDAAPLYATAAFLLFQCWFTESYFYTYW